MLALTHDAAMIIRSIVDQSPVPEEGGLRIVAEPVGEDAKLELSIAEEPDALDEVIEQDGAHVFLEPVASQALADKVLDASVEEGSVRFTVQQQPEGPDFGPDSGGPLS